MVQSKIKLCPIHGETEFHFYEKSGRNGQWKCLKCESELAVLKKQKYKLKMIQYKGGKCEICGYDKNIAALEFHHLNPEEKEFTVSDTHHSWEDTQKELDKCICVCANCHRELHNPQSTPKNLQQLIDNHKYNIEIKKTINKKNKYKFTLEEVNSKRKECKDWKEVADYYGISLSTLKRHKKELEEQSSDDGVA